MGSPGRFFASSGTEGSCDGSGGMSPPREGDRGEIRVVQFNSGWERCSARSEAGYRATVFCKIPGSAAAEKAPLVTTSAAPSARASVPAPFSSRDQFFPTPVLV